MSDQKHEYEPLNEEPGKEIKNSFPKGEEIDFRKAGRAGVRILVEQALRTHHGFDKPLWEQLEITPKAVARAQPQVIEALRKIVADPERDRYTDRTAAVMALGEVARAEAVPELVAVLESRFEKPTTRGWAAVTLGRVGKDAAVEILPRYLDHPLAPFRRKVAEGLAATQRKAVVEPLRRLAERDADDTVALTALEGLRRLEKRFRLKPARIKARKRAEGGGETRTAAAD